MAALVAAIGISHAHQRERPFMSHTSPWMRLCDCRCPTHHGYQRTTYSDEGCACAITCATQPMTLLAEQWNCAMFLDPGGDLWFVCKLPGGQWDWASCGQVHGSCAAPPRSCSTQASCAAIRHSRFTPHPWAWLGRPKGRPTGPFCVSPQEIRPCLNTHRPARSSAPATAAAPPMQGGIASPTTITAATAG